MDHSIQAYTSFQSQVAPWLLETFGADIAGDVVERNHRFLEEAIELVQSKGCTRSEAHQLVDYVFDRPMGEPAQEVGGVMVTLAALCLAADMDMHVAGDDELRRIWTKVEEIRAKQAAKPKHSPLPVAPYASWTKLPAGYPYQTRHTFASTLLSAGENPVWVATMMGHKDWAMIIKVYGRWIPSIAPDAGNKVAALWAPAEVTENEVGKP